MKTYIFKHSLLGVILGLPFWVVQKVISLIITRIWLLLQGQRLLL